MTFINRVRIENYRSIASCDVRLGPLTVIAGPNAAGKSNFLDAIRFVRDALDSSLEEALGPRGGLEEVLHRGGAEGQSDFFRIWLEGHSAVIDQPDVTSTASDDFGYMLEVGTDPAGRALPFVRAEEFFTAGRRNERARFTRETAPVGLTELQDELMLPAAAGSQLNTMSLYSDLRSMRFYELLTPVLRDVDVTPLRRRTRRLGENGEHLARVLRRLADEEPWAKDLIDGYLSTMIDNAVGVDGIEVPEGGLAFLVGRFLGEGGEVQKVDWRSLSEGTLRLVGVLAALFQPRALNGPIPFIAIEEPEVSLHPPMQGALYDALVAASRNTQVMVTTQSADLLDNAAADSDHLLVARNDGGGTVIGPIDRAGRQLLADGVLSLPELLRSGEMRPEAASEDGEGDR